ncbi:hypothetical protein MKX08_007381 [Trichoderma sp. CBMAI-0020]|nr:hypothetical protein MKX08_007381 [Trichoderma sp. CBMAI-0020]
MVKYEHRVARTSAIETLKPSTNGKIKPTTDDGNGNYNDDPYGNNDNLPGPSLTLPEDLWNQAYNEIKESDPKSMQLYETILSNKLMDHNFDPSRNVLEENAINAINQLDIGVRRDQMRQLIKTGQHRIELESQIKSGIKQTIDFMEPAKDAINSIVKTILWAILPWTVISVALEILRNPVDENETNVNGIQYVTKRMGWYWGIALDTLDLADKDVQSDTKTYIKLTLVEIYREILLFQIKSICSYYRNRGFSFLRDLVKFDDWESHLENICKLENEFDRDYHQYASHQNINSNLKIQSSLERLVGLLLERKEIEIKEDLQWELLSWIFKNSQFREWHDNESSRLLWVKGDPGKGKTMLICGILQNLENSMPFRHFLSYFFCQGTDQRLNKASDVLRGLIYMLVSQQHSLLSHVLKEYNTDGSSSFENVNSWVALANIFENIVQDPASRGCCVVIDALDECAVDRKKLLGLIVHHVSNTPGIKWSLSSRNHVGIENKLDTCPSSFRIDLEINADTVSGAVEAYIQNRIPHLGLLKNRENLHVQVCSEMVRKANGTFIWAALVFKEFESFEDCIAETDDQVLSLLKSIPNDLTELYHRMMKQVLEIPEDVLENRKHCINILTTMAVAFRPLQLVELLQLIGYTHNGLERVDFEQKSLQNQSGFAFIKDTFRFMFFNRVMIEEAPLQVYVSALIFSPKTSVVRLQFQQELSWIKTLPVVDEYWDYCKYIFFCPEGLFYSYAVSYDSKFVAVAYSSGLEVMDVTNDKKLWSSQSYVREFKTDPKESLVKVQFSGNSTLMAVIYYQFIAIMDATTGGIVKRFHCDQNHLPMELSIDMELVAEWQSSCSLCIKNTYTEEIMYEFNLANASKTVLSPGFKFIAIETNCSHISVRDITWGLLAT